MLQISRGNTGTGNVSKDYHPHNKEVCVQSHLGSLREFTFTSYSHINLCAVTNLSFFQLTDFLMHILLFYFYFFGY